ncbi:head GIN domain-containing protein [Altererythrobacter sp. CAU 1778]
MQPFRFIPALAKALLPVAGLAAAGALAGCNSNISINDDEGVPLSELDFASATPSGIVLASSDRVEVSRGDQLTVVVEGSEIATDRMRFTLDQDTLGIIRVKGKWNDSEKSVVRVTIPALREVVLAGSGTLRSEGLRGDSSVTIAGSGSVETMGVDADELDVTIAGSGGYKAAGRAKKLDLTVAGSGSADMADLKVDGAEVSVMGSGDAGFASDGTVKATIMGSGTVRVTGDATCEVSSMGSGKLICKTVETKED